jgi:uncharacterized membrane protein YfcA
VLLTLCLAAFFAGFVDSIAGGGGLIQLPALFVFLPPAIAAQVPQVMGINKFSSICGTTVATLQYARKVDLQWKLLIPMAFAAFVFSFLGARTVTLLNPELIKPIILVLLVAVAIYTYARQKATTTSFFLLPEHSKLWVALAAGAAIGFYDGFFGPGTGTFLLIAFVGLFALDFLHASAHAKAINLTTNIAAVAWFASTGNIPYQYAVPMALANIAGSFIGSHMAILKGSEFVRKFFLAVVLLLIARFAYEMAFAK